MQIISKSKSLQQLLEAARRVQRHVQGNQRQQLPSLSSEEQILQRLKQSPDLRAF